MTIAAELARKMLIGQSEKVTTETEDAPLELTRLTEELKPDAGSSKTWVFTDGDLGTKGRTLSVHHFPWGATEARLTSRTVEPAHSDVGDAIASLRSIKF